MSILFVMVACAPFIWCLAIRGILAHTNVSSGAPSFGWWQQWIYYPTYARLDAELARTSAPLVAYGSSSAHELFSARIGCQSFGAYGTDIAALCVRNGAR